MESTGEANKIHCSAQSKAILDRLGAYDITERGVVHLKGKGDIKTFWLDDKSTLLDEITPLPPLPVRSESPRRTSLFAVTTPHNSSPNVNINRTPQSSLKDMPEKEKPPRKNSVISYVKQKMRHHGSFSGKKGDPENPAARHLMRRGSGPTWSREKNQIHLPMILDESVKPLLDEVMVNGEPSVPRVRNGMRLSRSTPPSATNLSALENLSKARSEQTYDVLSFQSSDLLKKSTSRSTQDITQRSRLRSDAVSLAEPKSIPAHNTHVIPKTVL